MAQLMPLLVTVSCFSKVYICFTFLVLAHLDKGPLNGCVCVWWWAHGCEQLAQSCYAAMPWPGLELVTS